MHKLVALAVLPLPLLLTGCPTPFGCGGYTGGGDHVFQRGTTDLLIECDNGGFVETTASGTLEGMFSDGTAIDPATRGVDFTTTTNADGTLTTPELTGGNWSPANLDQVALDHADTMCTDLESRSWWGQSTATVGQVTEYINTTAPLAADTQRLILCPSGSLYVSMWFGIGTGSYDLVDGEVEWTGNSLGTLLANSELDTHTDGGGEAGEFWELTTDEAAAAASFCTTGTWVAPEAP